MSTAATDPFRALADPTRRAVLLRVAERPRAVNELAGEFDMSRPAVSKHLRLLEQAGLLSFRTDGKDGRQRIVHAELAALAEIGQYLDELRSIWERRLDKLDDLLDDLQ